MSEIKCVFCGLSMFTVKKNIFSKVGEFLVIAIIFSIGLFFSFLLLGNNSFTDKAFNFSSFLFPFLLFVVTFCYFLSSILNEGSMKCCNCGAKSSSEKDDIGLGMIKNFPSNFLFIIFLIFFLAGITTLGKLLGSVVSYGFLFGLSIIFLFWSFLSRKFVIRDLFEKEISIVKRIFILLTLCFIAFTSISMLVISFNYFFYIKELFS